MSRPLDWTSDGGNFRICCGTLVALPAFAPHGGYIIEVTGGNNGHQNIGLNDLSLDGSLVANGIFLLNVLRGDVSDVYIIHFPGAGIRVEKGHEVDIHDSFIGQYIWDESPQPITNSSAIILNGNDHIVHDCVIFSATGVGILDTGGANGIEGVHIYGAMSPPNGSSWNPPLNPQKNVSVARGGIVLEGWGWQSRIVNNYFDGEDLVLQLGGATCCPQAITGNLFLSSSRIIIRPSSNRTNITGLAITGNIFAGLGRCQSTTECASIWVDDDLGSIHSFSGSSVTSNSCSGGKGCVGSTATRSLHLVNATKWELDFEFGLGSDDIDTGSKGNSLLRGILITNALYSVAVEDGSFPRHHMLPLPDSAAENRLAVAVVTDTPTTATVTVTASQEEPDCDIPNVHSGSVPTAAAPSSSGDRLRPQAGQGAGGSSGTVTPTVGRLSASELVRDEKRWSLERQRRWYGQLPQDV